jgi:hypothetical protein
MGDATTITNLGEMIDGFYQYALSIVGIAVFSMFLYAGFKFMFGKGSEGWKIIQDAIIGALILFSAVVILNAINPDLVRQESRIPNLQNPQSP